MRRRFILPAGGPARACCAKPEQRPIPTRMNARSLASPPAARGCAPLRRSSGGTRPSPSPGEMSWGGKKPRFRKPQIQSCGAENFPEVKEHHNFGGAGDNQFNWKKARGRQNATILWGSQKILWTGKIRRDGKMPGFWGGRRKSCGLGKIAEMTKYHDLGGVAENPVDWENSELAQI